MFETHGSENLSLNRNSIKVQRNYLTPFKMCWGHTEYFETRYLNLFNWLK